MVNTPEIKEHINAVRAGAFAFGPLNTLDLIRLSGSDALSFLQNRCTNDVAALQPGQGCHNAVLNKQAQIQGVFSTHRPASSNNDWLLLTDTAQTAPLLTHLKRYHITEQVTFDVLTADYQFFAVQGIPAAAVLSNGLGPQALQLAGLGEWGLLQEPLWGIEATLIKRSMTGEGGYIVWVPQHQSAALEQALLQASDKLALNRVILTPDILAILRVEAGLPQFGLDYDHDTLLPETGLEQTTVSYTKGCYLGQETVARVKTYGSVQKALIGLTFQPGVPLPVPNQPLYQDGKNVGTLKSVVDSPTLGCPIALAYLGKAYRIPGNRLTLQIGEPSQDAPALYDVTVHLLPFYTATQLNQQASTLLHQGLTAFANGDDDTAITQLREALALDATLYDAYEALGVILGRRNHYDEAISLMHKLAEADPERVMAHTNLSVFYMKIGNIEKAEEEKAKATILGMKQKAKAAGLTIPSDVERQQKETATRQRITLFLEALKYNPDDPLGNFGLASAYAELGEHADAVEPFQKTLAAQPNHSACYLTLGKTYEALNQLENAQQIYHQGIKVAAQRRDLMPLNDMQQRLAHLTEQLTVETST